MVTTRLSLEKSNFGPAPKQSTPRPRPEDVERDLRIAEAAKRTEELVKTATELRDLIFPLVYGTRLEDPDES